MRPLPVLLTVALLVGTATADELTFPLVVDYPFLRTALERELHEEADGTALLWGRRGGCRFVTLHDLQMARAGGRVRLTGRVAARVAIDLFGLCIGPVTWQGHVETLATPEITPDWRLRFRDLDSHVYDAEWGRATVTSRVWDVVKGRFERELEDFEVDLRPPVDEAKALLRSSVDADYARAIVDVLETIRPLHVTAGELGVEVRVAVDVPAGQPLVRTPEPSLAPIELQKWQAALESWDGFVVFVIKDLGAIDRDQAVRDELLALLLGSRRELLAVLAGGPEVGVDPVRRLFIDVWERLRGIVRAAASHGALEDRALRYLSFLAAGDALVAIDAAGPSLGIEISPDGLRRLARVLEPEFAGDPVAYSEDPDAALRELFDFHDPASTAVPTREPPPPDASSWWIGPGAANAAGPPSEGITDLARRLDRWVPADAELEAYRGTVGRLLALVTERTATANAIDERFAKLYADLVPAAAWQESCWRQFVRRKGRVTYLLSKSGDVGIMQVNRRVWRGFFEVAKLEWDVAYNAGAGAEILAQLLRRYGVRESSGKLENAARATYAAYNGGPDAYRRYRLGKIPRAQRAVDRAFWDKFQAMAAGQAFDFVLCIERWESGRRERLSTGPVASTPKCSIRSRSSSATTTISARHASIASRPRASFV